MGHSHTHLWGGVCVRPDGEEEGGPVGPVSSWGGGSPHQPTLRGNWAHRKDKPCHEGLHVCLYKMRTISAPLEALRELEGRGGEPEPHLPCLEFSPEQNTLRRGLS